jgi:hypothetical protein
MSSRSRGFAENDTINDEMGHVTSLCSDGFITEAPPAGDNHVRNCCKALPNAVLPPMVHWSRFDCSPAATAWTSQGYDKVSGDRAVATDLVARGRGSVVSCRTLFFSLAVVPFPVCSKIPTHRTSKNNGRTQLAGASVRCQRARQES